MCFALFAWFPWAELLAGIAKTAAGEASKECKTLGWLGLDCVKMLGHSHFLDYGRKKQKKGHQEFTAKSATAFPEFVYITIYLSNVSACNCCLNRLNLWLFFRWFSHGKSTDCEKKQINLLK